MRSLYDCSMQPGSVSYDAGLSKEWYNKKRQAGPGKGRWAGDREG